MARKRVRGRIKVLLGFLIFLDVIALALSLILVYGNSLYSKMDSEELVLEEGEVLVSEEVLENKKKSSVKNIALFGVDSRTDSYSGTRSDAMMVLSYNKETKKAYITSVVRDTYSYLGEKYGYDKLNHAYSFGGPALAIQTLNRQFDLDIEQYVTVNFNAVAEIIDRVGGVTVDIQGYELDELNRVILEMNEYNDGGKLAAVVKNTGTQTLSGRQAVAYMRIRKVGNGDFERMERQREVIQLVFEKLSSKGKLELVEIAESILPYVKTNLSLTEILSEGLGVVLGGINSIEQRQLPTTDLSYGTKLSNGVYYLVPKTLSENVSQWHEAVYEEESYEPTSTVQTISQQIKDKTGIY